MITLDAKWLADRGLSDLDSDAKSDLLRSVFSALEIRVGERVAEGLTCEQLAEFEEALEDGETYALDWLESNVPDYQETTAAGARRVGARNYEPGPRSSWLGSAGEAL